MPTYLFRCRLGDEIEADFPMAEVPRTITCPHDHQPAIRVLGAGLQIAPSALETKGGEAREKIAWEKEWDVDIPAYRRMRSKGLQPKHVDGAAAVEDTVADQFDIDYGHLKSEGVTKERIREGKEQAAEIMREAAEVAANA